MEIDDIKIDEIKEKGKEEVIVVDDNKKPADEGSKGDNGGNADPQPGPAAVVPKIEVDDAEADFTSLSDEIGYEIRSNEEIVSNLKELANYRQGKIPGLSPALQRAIEIEKQGGNISAYFQALTLEEDKMDEREILQHAFMQGNEIAKSNPKLARMDFERDFRNKYSVYLTYQSLKDEAEKGAYLEKNADEIQYQEERYKFDVAKSKQAVKDFKDNFPSVVPGGMTQAQIDEVVTNYNREVDGVIKEFKAIDIPIEGDEVLKLGTDSETAPLVERWAREPDSFLKSIGIDLQANKVDIKTLHPVMVAIANLSQGSFGARFKSQILANKDIKTIENELGGSREIKRGLPGSVELDQYEQLAQVAEQKRGRN